MDERREDTRAAAGLGGGRGAGPEAANPGPPGRGGQSHAVRKLTAPLPGVGQSAAGAAEKEAESETPPEGSVPEHGVLKKLALGIFRRGPASEQKVRVFWAETLP